MPLMNARQLNRSIERVIGPPDGYEKIVEVGPLPDRRFMACVQGQHRECPAVIMAGLRTQQKCTCTCVHHRQQEPAGAD